jgi:hypothetical protein
MSRKMNAVTAARMAMQVMTILTPAPQGVRDEVEEWLRLRREEAARDRIAKVESKAVVALPYMTAEDAR